MKLCCASGVSALLANKRKSETNHFKSLNFIGATRDTRPPVNSALRYNLLALKWFPYSYVAVGFFFFFSYSAHSL